MQTAKGLFFILITGGFLYLLLQAFFRELKGRLVRSEELGEELTAMIHHIPLGVLLLERDGVIITANRMAEDLLGEPLSALTGRSFYSLPFGSSLAEGFSSQAPDPLGVLKQSQIHTEFAYQYEHPRGGRLTLLLHGFRIEREGREPRILVLLEDITAPFSPQAGKHLSQYLNPLTGLPNREMFLYYLHLSLSHARHHQRSLGVIWIDLDRFYEINQVLGREIGNLLLQEVAERLKKALRSTDILAHLGGDKFLVLVPDLPLSEGEGNLEEKKALEVGARIRKALAPPFQFQGHTLSITASMGISLYPQHQGEAEELLQYAETAAQMSKREGAGHITVFSPEFLKNHSQDLSLRNRLSLALSEKEFVLYFQPIVDLKTSRWIGAEALLRWRREGEGVRNASEFLPIILSHGLIHELEEWIITEVIRTLKSWEEQGIVLNLSFNIAVPFQTEKLLLQHLSQVDPPLRRRLIIELTENVLMVNPLQGYRLVEELNDLGVALALDDFGTGYSSLQRLKELPILYMKIDRMFVRTLPQETDLAIIQAILGLGKNLGKLVIAEGIERKEQYELLRVRQCALGQGYFFAPPLPEEEFLAHYWRSVGHENPRGEKR